jgi:hypothetical protein
VTALIGPGARGCCYEVGEEVHARFDGYDARRGDRNIELAAIAAAQGFGDAEVGILIANGFAGAFDRGRAVAALAGGLPPRS